MTAMAKMLISRVYLNSVRLRSFSIKNEHIRKTISDLKNVSNQWTWASMALGVTSVDKKSHRLKASNSSRDRTVCDPGFPRNAGCISQDARQVAPKSRGNAKNNGWLGRISHGRRKSRCTKKHSA